MDGSVNNKIQGIEEDIREIAVDNPRCDQNTASRGRIPFLFVFPHSIMLTAYFLIQP